MKVQGHPPVQAAHAEHRPVQAQAQAPRQVATEQVQAHASENAKAALAAAGKGGKLDVEA